MHWSNNGQTTLVKCARPGRQEAVREAERLVGEARDRFEAADVATRLAPQEVDEASRLRDLRRGVEVCPSSTLNPEP